LVQRSRDAAVQCILCQWDMRYRRSVLPPSQPRAPCGVWALPLGRRRSTAPHACLYVWCVPHGLPAGMARMAGSRTGRRSSTPGSTSRARSALSGTPYAGYYAIYRRIGCVRCRYCSRCRVPASVSATDRGTHHACCHSHEGPPSRCAGFIKTVWSRAFFSRYGQIHRGDKVKIAQQFGLCGLILYTDPADYNQTNPYPKGTRPPSL
jgi:hypothetical protein